MKYLKENQVAEVEWGDAHSGWGWKDREEVLKNHSPTICNSIGYVVKHDKVGISLAKANSPEGSPFGGVSFIPAAMVRKLRTIR